MHTNKIKSKFAYNAITRYMKRANKFGGGDRTTWPSEAWRTRACSSCQWDLGLAVALGFRRWSVDGDELKAAVLSGVWLWALSAAPAENAARCAIGAEKGEGEANRRVRRQIAAGNNRLAADRYIELVVEFSNATYALQFKSAVTKKRKWSNFAFVTNINIYYS